MPTLNINGGDVAVDADPATPLLWALRDNLNLTGTIQAVSGVTATDIDSSGGWTINNPNGTLTRTVNWSTTTTRVTRASVSVS